MTIETRQVECAICAAGGIETHTFDPNDMGWARIPHDRDRDGLEVRDVWACDVCAPEVAHSSDSLITKVLSPLEADYGRDPDCWRVYVQVIEHPGGRVIGTPREVGYITCLSRDQARRLSKYISALGRDS